MVENHLSSGNLKTDEGLTDNILDIAAFKFESQITLSGIVSKT